jgi:two-component system cell cycle response regulator CtrA
MRTLLIEDDDGSRRAIELMLTSAGFNVDSAATGEDGLALASVYPFQSIVLDMNLGDISGLEVLRRLRRNGHDTPVLILSGRSDVSGKVEALTAGADDYLCKPCHVDELTARMKALVRRAAGQARSVIELDDLTLDMTGRTVHVGESRVQLTSKEYQLLELLALRKDRPVARDALLTALYDGNDEPGGKIIDVFVCKVRQKLSAASGGRRFIDTVWGGGYVLRSRAA